GFSEIRKVKHAPQNSDTSVISSIISQDERLPMNCRTNISSSSSSLDSVALHPFSHHSSPSSSFKITSQNSSCVTPKTSPNVEKLPYLPYSPFHLFSYDVEEPQTAMKEKEAEEFRENSHCWSIMLLLVTALVTSLLCHVALHHCCSRSALLLTAAVLLPPSSISPLLRGLHLHHTASTQTSWLQLSAQLLPLLSNGSPGHLSVGTLGCLSARPPINWTTSQLRHVSCATFHLCCRSSSSLFIPSCRTSLGGLLTSSYRQHQESLAVERERRRQEREERLQRIEREERNKF
ncbi:hypothetical protein E2320_002441, partial [Naja naja]